MRILFIFTGGTIGSTEVCGVRRADASKPYKILSMYQERYGIDFEYDTAEPYTELSENLTGEHLKRLICEVKRGASAVCGNGRKYDGVIVTHGTDTLQYSSAALGYALGLDSIPVCLVSANAPIENEKSNGLINLRAAVRFIELRAGRGVFCVYANADSSEGYLHGGKPGLKNGNGQGRVLIHRATRLMPPKIFSDECASIFGQSYGGFNEKFEFIKNTDFHELADEIDAFPTDALTECSDEILVITPYVGMVYPSLDRVRWVIMNTYHSGTLDVKSERALRFFERARRMGVTVFAVGGDSKLCYSSSDDFSRLGIIPVDRISPIAAYIKIVGVHVLSPFRSL